MTKCVNENMISTILNNITSYKIYSEDLTLMTTHLILKASLLTITIIPKVQGLLITFFISRRFDT